MKKTLTLLLTSSILAGAVALPAASALRDPGDEPMQVAAAIAEGGQQARPVRLASDDDDHRRGYARHDDDDHRRGDRRYEDDDDDDEGGRSPARAGSATPPQNGLFGSTGTPKVTVQ